MGSNPSPRILQRKLQVQEREMEKDSVVTSRIFVAYKRDDGTFTHPGWLNKWENLDKQQTRLSRF